MTNCRPEANGAVKGERQDAKRVNILAVVFLSPSPFYSHLNSLCNSQIKTPGSLRLCFYQMYLLQRLFIFVFLLKKNKLTLIQRNDNVWCFSPLLFITIYCTSLNCICQKHTQKKNPLNNKPVRTITEHLIEITNHKIQCSKHTLRSLTRRHTRVASKLCS